ncbi:hypothetical protein Rsub_04309 [Raphidocelis subcapitata]|uniref:Uncharacterized protein n=1 Tax=Raphidocelis subcapitata TaxID=307507 RepID=A0A2V0NW64_9CHLO|nr:hypothetical protein Rsub_04309 [Raphidocelis subcapitata]|eukprot:GBF91569.1 hypothetical protein Rsub_04309 [Raphidocelis subcapitata]
MLACCTAARAGRPGSTLVYESLEPFANAVDVRGIWKAAGLPPPPPVLCHVGLLGWHCHNTTLNPWNPKSIIPKGSAPPMPANATCVICPSGWKGPRGSLFELLLDLPAYAKSEGGKLPPGMWDGAKLMAEAEAEAARRAQAEAAAGVEAAEAVAAGAGAGAAPAAPVAPAAAAATVAGKTAAAASRARRVLNF